VEGVKKVNVDRIENPINDVEAKAKPAPGGHCNCHKASFAAPILESLAKAFVEQAALARQQSE
jgi:hypothetical protein